MRAAKVYRNGLIAELIGSTNVTTHVYTRGETTCLPLCTRIERIMIGAQHAKSDITMAPILMAILRSCLLSRARPACLAVCTVVTNIPA